MRVGLLIQGPLLSIGRGAGNYQKKKDTPEDHLIKHDCSETIIRNINNYRDLFDEICISTWDDEIVPKKLELFLENQEINIFQFNKENIKKLPKLKVPNRWTKSTKNIMSRNNNLIQYTGCYEGSKKFRNITHLIRIRTDQEVDIKKLIHELNSISSKKILVPSIHYENEIYQISDFYFGGDYQLMLKFFDCSSKYHFDNSPHINPILAFAKENALTELEIDESVLSYSKESFQYKILQNHVIKTNFFPCAKEIYTKIRWRGEDSGSEWQEGTKNKFFNHNFQEIQKFKISDKHREIDSFFHSPKKPFWIKFIRKIVQKLNNYV